MVSDWQSEFGTGFNFDVARWYLGGDPWSNRDHWLERSAYSHLDQVTTPTILFHGERDRTDTMAQSMNFFAGLTHLGVESRFPPLSRARVTGYPSPGTTARGWWRNSAGWSASCAATRTGRRPSVRRKTRRRAP